MAHSSLLIRAASVGLTLCQLIALSPLALADESDCQTGAYACFSPTALDYTYSGPASPCTAPPPPGAW